jgi:TP901 family phage tail tape measure protein
MAGLLPTLKALVTADTSDFDKKMRGVQKRMSGTTAGIRAATPALLALSAATIGVGVASTKMAVDFDREMTKIVTLVGVADAQVNQWRKDILALAPAVGRGPRELSKAMFFITSAGQRGAEALRILENAARASAVGLGDTAEVARAVTAAVNAYGVEVLDAKRATEILVATIREGNLEASELAPVLGRVIGVAQQMGVAFEEIGAFVATFTRLGISAEIAVTSLRGLLTIMLRGGRRAKMMNEALAPVGLSVEKLRKQISERGLTAALIDMFDALGGNISALSQAIPNVRALAGAMGTAGAQAETFEIILDNIRNSVGILDEAFKRTLATPAQNFAMLKAQIEATAIALGNELTPAATSVVQAILPLLEGLTLAIKAFSALPGPVKGAVVGLTGLLALLGPLALILTTIIGPLSTFSLALGGVGLGGALAVLAGPAGWIAAVVAGLGLLAISFGKARREAEAFEEQQRRVAEIGKVLAIGPALQVARTAASELSKEMREIREGLKDMDFEAKQAIAKGLTDRMEEAAIKVARLQGELEKTVTGLFGIKGFRQADIFDVFGTRAEEAGEKAQKAVEQAIAEFDELKGTLGSVETSIAGVVDEIEDVGDAGAEAAKKIQAFLDSLQSSADALADEAAEMTGGVGAALTLQIAREGLTGAALAQAETIRDLIVLRAAEVEAMRKQEAASKSLQREIEQEHRRRIRFQEQNEKQARDAVRRFLGQLRQAELIAEAQRLESTFRSISESIGDFFSSIATDGENALDALKRTLGGILRAIQDFVTQEFVVEPLFGFLRDLRPTPRPPPPVTGVEPPPDVRDLTLPRLGPRGGPIEGFNIAPILVQGETTIEVLKGIVPAAAADTEKVTSRQDTQTRLIAELGGNVQLLARVLQTQQAGMAQGTTALRTGRGAADFEAFLTRTGAGLRPLDPAPVFAAPLRGGRGKGGGPGREIRIPRLELFMERTSEAVEESADTLGSVDREIAASPAALAVLLPAALAPLFASLLSGIFGESTFGKIASTVLGIGASVFTAGVSTGKIKLFQGGGTFRAGDAFIAGEVGPELIRPKASGEVVSSKDLAKLLAARPVSSSQPPAVVFNINATSLDPAFAVELFEREAPALGRAFVRATEANRGLRRSFLE